MYSATITYVEVTGHGTGSLQAELCKEVLISLTLNADSVAPKVSFELNFVFNLI